MSQKNPRQQWNEQGQMAIFIALIFQILFVFFAMVINIGLIVHDKINLQNAVDLAAYYGAERQAETLNEIAAINYQMRQDFKLLTWRMRVLGSFGTSARHPSFDPRNDTGPREVAYEGADSAAVCMSHSAWSEIYRSSRNENLCQRTNLAAIPEIPAVSPIATFLPFNVSIISFVEQMRQNAFTGCRQAGPYNWALAARFLMDYRFAIGQRRLMIESLANNLSEVNDKVRDTDSEYVESGIKSTLVKNLTFANARGLTDVKIFNSMGPEGGCGDPNVWLPKILINPVVNYVDSNDSSGCTLRTKSVRLPPDHYVESFDPGGYLKTVVRSEPPDQERTRSMLGFEKNPWCMTYIGVKASTQPRKPFAPFGQPVSLEARAFAGPFGGRIGPWYGRTWSRNSDKSEGLPTDALVPTRAGVGFVNQTLKDSVNYSRFPGDTLGLKSRAALGISRAMLAPLVNPANTAIERLSIEHFNFKVAEQRDVLAWDVKLNRAPYIRNAEAAAVAPDLFDATYYSIEPMYYANYFFKSNNTGRFQTLEVISDVGSRLTFPNLLTFSVSDQIKLANTGGIDRTMAYYVIKDPAHLLTGWTQNRAQDYTFPFDKFATCLNTPAPSVPTPGNCVRGGRTGYSVRILSRDYLRGPQSLSGVSGGSAEPIRNPPPEDF